MQGFKVIGALSAAVAATTILTIALSLSVDAMALLFSRYGYLAVAFPLAGILVYCLYRALKVPFEWGTKHIVGNEECEERVSARVVPAIFIGTCATILVGGSVGKEAAALQMGGGMAASVSRRFELDDDQRRLVLACTLACALGVLLGTPIASAVFAVEVLQYRAHVWHYVAVLLSALFSKVVAWCLSLNQLKEIVPFPSIDAGVMARVMILILLCALLSAAFCACLSWCRGVTLCKKAQIPSLVIMGAAAVVFLCCFSGDLYSGTGMVEVGLAMKGAVDTPFFAGKALFTLAILGAGFKGGEIMPTLCVGATFGCFSGYVLGVDPQFAAAIGLVAYFGACTNCPLAAALVGCEAFGFAGIGWFLVASFAAYAPFRQFGFYGNASFYVDMARDVYRRMKSVVKGEEINDDEESLTVG